MYSTGRQNTDKKLTVATWTTVLPTYSYCMTIVLAVLIFCFIHLCNIILSHLCEDRDQYAYALLIQCDGNNIVGMHPCGI